MPLRLPNVCIHVCAAYIVCQTYHIVQELRNLLGSTSSCFVLVNEYLASCSIHLTMSCVILSMHIFAFIFVAIYHSGILGMCLMLVLVSDHGID